MTLIYDDVDNNTRQDSDVLAVELESSGHTHQVNTHTAVCAVCVAVIVDMYWGRVSTEHIDKSYAVFD